MTERPSCRNNGHRRWIGLQDHHILHYLSTLSTFIQLAQLYADIFARQRAEYA